MPNSFAFVLNPLIIEGSKNDPIEITPNYFLQKADEEQINVLKQTWPKLPASLFWLNSYEYEYGLVNRPKHEPSRLGPADWRYWVISHAGHTSQRQKQTTFFILECAMSLSKSNLETGLLFFDKQGNSYQWNYRSFYSYFFDYPSGGHPATQIEYKEIQEIGTNHTLLDEFMKKMYTIHIYSKGQKVDDINQYYQENFEYIDYAIRRYVDLKALPRYSGLTIIGLFSIIESLITHDPKQNIDDSLNHQLKTKIPLLRKKFHRPLDYQNYFSSANEETILGKLYDFRSKIVHQGKETIEKDNKILNNLESVTDFLRETTRLLIMLAVREPQFVTDLKKC
ncbi:MAG: hypothetical protein WBW94_10960 [Anaerolineales bacterium]